jgi:hypothetical protein
MFYRAVACGRNTVTFVDDDTAIFVLLQIDRFIPGLPTEPNFLVCLTLSTFSTQPMPFTILDEFNSF